MALYPSQMFRSTLTKTRGESLMVVWSLSPRAAKAQRESAKRLRTKNNTLTENQRVKEFQFGGSRFVLQLAGPVMVEEGRQKGVKGCRSEFLITLHYFFFHIPPMN